MSVYLLVCPSVRVSVYVLVYLCACLFFTPLYPILHEAFNDPRFISLIHSFSDDSDDDDYTMQEEEYFDMNNFNNDNDSSNINNENNNNKNSKSKINYFKKSSRYLLSTSLDIDTKLPYKSEIKGLPPGMNNYNTINRSGPYSTSTAEDFQTILVTSMLMGLGEGKEGKVNL